MLLAASESAVTKNPRLRLMMRRSSSVRPLGSFHNAMSRVMFTSCGIQWLAQVARYFSQAHLYLNGTSWLTSVWPLMMRLSAAVTRRAVCAMTDFAGVLFDGTVICAAAATTACVNTGADIASRGDGETGRASRSDAASKASRGLGKLACGDRRSSSQTSMCVLPMAANYRSVVFKHQALLDISARSLLRACIDVGSITDMLRTSDRRCCRT